MILAVRYSIKGVKKGHQKYKEHKAEKERKLLEERGQLPDIQDPSRELDTSCLAEPDLKRQHSSLSRSRSRSSSLSQASAEKALENDPAFKEYMERHRSLYLQQHRENGQPPSYDSAMQNRLTSPASRAGRSSLEQSATPSHYQESVATKPYSGHNLLVPEMPAPHHSQTSLNSLSQSHLSELDAGSAANRSVIVEADSSPITFELPGNMPAILPDLKAPSELPAQTT